jgi:beta-lactam-binding protein with PASTA domain
VQVEAYPTGPPNLAGAEAGYYDFGAGTSWATEMARITGVDTATGDIGPAEFSWNLTPSMKVKQKFCLVPAVTGIPLASAQAAITSAKCTVGPIADQPSDVVPQGDVISSNPAEGTVQPVGTKVALVVSSGPQCTVPTVAGQPLAAAESALVGAHCAVGQITKRTSSTVAKGKVISSAPGAGTTHPAGTMVALTVSKGKKPKKKCVVPAVKGQTVPAASGALASANCAVGKITIKPSSTVPRGRVISSAPPAGTVGPADMRVALTVSGKKNKKRCVVPRLKGKKLAAAKTALKRAHCAVGKVTKTASSKIAKGKVISSKPKAGTAHPAGTKVALKVSKGAAKGKQTLASTRLSLAGELRSLVVPIARQPRRGRRIRGIQR